MILWFPASAGFFLCAEQQEVLPIKVKMSLHTSWGRARERQAEGQKMFHTDFKTIVHLEMFFI
jgi:hypothetical protein